MIARYSARRYGTRVMRRLFYRLAVGSVFGRVANAARQSLDSTRSTHSNRESGGKASGGNTIANGTLIAEPGFIPGGLPTSRSFST